MLSALTAGVVFGLSAGLAPGPLLMLVITQTLRHNMREGMKVAVAPLITDLPIVSACLLILTRLAQYHGLLGLISCLGGFYVVSLAYETFRTRPVDLELQPVHPRSLRKGVLINALNPHPYVFWLTVGVPLVLKAWEENPLASGIFVFSFYLLLVGSKMALALLVGKSQVLLTGKGYQWVRRSLAVLLGAFSLFLFRDALKLWGIV